MRTWLKLTGTLAAMLMMASTAMAADHRDAPGTTGDPTTDINDVYAFTAGDDLILAMTVFPAADNTSHFSDAVQYVFNLDTGTAFGQTVDSKKVVCTVAGETTSCYLGVPEEPAQDWVIGEAGVEGGITSESGMFKVFAGLRADPFFFNLNGFKDAVVTVEGAAGGLTFDPANCPNVNEATSATLVNMLQKTSLGTAPAQDFFGPLNTLAIVVSIDKSLLTADHADHSLVSVWASTHRAP